MQTLRAFGRERPPLVSQFLQLGFLAALLRTVNSASCYRTKDITVEEYPFCMQLDQSFALHWKTSTDKITFAVDADGHLNWLAVGVSEAGTGGIDFNICIRNAQQDTWLPYDFFMLNATTLPTVDYDQNVGMELAPVANKDNKTVAIFSRPLDSCDLEDIPLYYGVQRSIFWAYGDQQWEDQKLHFNYFLHGPAQSVQLVTDPKAAMTNTTNNTKVGMLTMPSTFTVPTTSYTVECINMGIPADQPYHVTSYQGFASSNMVHHMSAHVCAPGVVPPQLNIAYDCSKGLPAGCETLYFVGVPGMAAFKTPPEAGFLIGGGRSFMVLRVHYLNPTNVVGKVITYTGFNFTYTSTLRNNSLGVLSLGYRGTGDLMVPPGSYNAAAKANVCPANCTAQRVQGNVTLVSNFFLTNKLGRSVITRHIRNGTAIQPLGRYTYFDPSHMGHVGVMPGSRMLMPNDTLITNCTFDTSNTTKYTYGGYGPNNEFCNNYVTFYPVEAMPGLDTCQADAGSTVVASCSTATMLASLNLTGMGPKKQIASGAYFPVPINATTPQLYRSPVCKTYDEERAKPLPTPNTKAALASVIVVPIVLLAIGAVLWSKYAKEEALVELLEELRAAELEAESQGLTTTIVRAD